MNFYSLKFKFIAISLLIISSGLVAGLYYFVPKVQDHEKREAIENQQKLAQQLVINFNNYFQQTLAEVESLAKLPEVVSLEEDNLDQVISHANQLTQFFNYFFIVDPAGKWLSYPSKPHLKGKKLGGNSSWIQSVLNNKSTEYLDAHIATSIKTIVSGFATPVLSENGEAKAVIRGVITVSKDNALLNQIHSFKFGGNGYAYIVDSDGLLLAHPHISITYENFNELDYSSFEPVYSALNGESGVTEYKYEDQDWVVAYEPIASSGWALIVQQPLSDILQDAKAELHEFAFLLILSFLLFSALLVSFFFYSLTPLTRLLDKIRSHEPIEIESFPRDEIGTLARAFSKYNKQLEETVDSRTKQLRDTNADLVSTIEKLEESEKEKESLFKQMLQAQKLESIGVLAGGVAHDFNNLLTGIIGYADLALIKTPADSPIRENLEKQRKTCDKAAQLAQQLLAFSRKQVVDLKVVNFNSIVGDLIDMASRMIGETISLEVKIDSNLKNVRADKGRIEQVLMNLIVNARDAMPEGGTLCIQTANKEFDGEYAKRYVEVKEGQYAMISVSDTGHGMTKEVQEKIFDPFFTTKSIGKGTGLGMATVFGVVKQHEGYIYVYSELEQGTTFKIYLPAVTEDISAVAADDQKDANIQGTEKILVVDDNDVVRDFIGESLKYHGYQITIESSPQKALEKVAQSGEQYDLLLTDVVMPGMNGQKLAEGVRKIIPSIKIIFMSGYQDKIVPFDEVHKDPSMDFIAKPVVTNDLIKIIRKLLN